MKKIAQGIVFAFTVLSMMVPFFVWVMNPELTQMEVFLNTWMWLFYSVIVYLLGNSVVEGIYK